jgi:ribosomal protein S18 acetylase RimI-like enzyme
MADSHPRVALCPTEARGAALDVLYRGVPDALRHRLIAEVLSEANKGEIDLSGLWVAHGRNSQVIGALLTQRLPGRMAAVWAPEVRPTWRRAAVASELLQAALTDLRARGFLLAQAVLDESAGQRAVRDLARGGMPRVTELLYLERETAVPLQAEPRSRLTGARPEVAFDQGSIEWRPFEPRHEADFRAVLQATYVGSLDMPELDGARDLDDIMASHRAAGRFDAEHWQLGTIPGRPDVAAVLLMADIPDRDVWEIVYLGLTPPARGHGLGRAVIRRALTLAAPHVARVELAVDRRNIPATKLYQETGFLVRDRRTVHLAILEQQAP